MSYVRALTTICRLSVVYFVSAAGCHYFDPHKGTFQLQTDLPSVAALCLQNLLQRWGKNFKILSMVLKLNLEGMTKE